MVHSLQTEKTTGRGPLVEGQRSLDEPVYELSHQLIHKEVKHEKSTFHEHGSEQHSHSHEKVQVALQAKLIQEWLRTQDIVQDIKKIEALGILAVHKILPGLHLDLGANNINEIKVDSDCEPNSLRVWENFLWTNAKHKLGNMIGEFENSLNYDRDIVRTVIAKGTAYYPHDDPMNGGYKDKRGNPLHTVQDVVEGKSRYVSLAMGPNVPYGTLVRMPELSKKYGRPIIGCVVDTGGAFHGCEKVDVCVRSKSDTTDATINQPLTLQFLA